MIELNASQIKATGLDDQITFCQMKPKNLDQSWMPNWFSNTKTNPDLDYESDFEESASSSSSSDNDDDNHQLLNRVCKSVDKFSSYPILFLSCIL